MADNLPARIDDLPPSLADIAETLGMRVALGLLEHFGGLDIKFPQEPPADHPVVKVLGAKDALALCQFLGGMAMYVPRGRKTGTMRADVLALHQQGLRNADIARRLQLSERYVRMLLSDAGDERQADLFG